MQIVYCMVNYKDALNHTLSALADPTRRAIVSRLCMGPASVGELAEPFDIKLPALLKHVKVLERSGLVVSEKRGRVRTCRLETRALHDAEAWFVEHIATWERRLDRMEAHAKRIAANKESKK